MVLHKLEHRKALNKAFLKIKTNQQPLECFKVKLIQFSNYIIEKQIEKFYKNRIPYFFKKAAYDLNYSLNILGRNTLIIHNNHSANNLLQINKQIKWH
jgi:adenine-specific DNA-methyltransferase